MNQSAVTFMFLILAFVVFVTMRGELRTYMGFIIGGPNEIKNPPNVVNAKTAADITGMPQTNAMSNQTPWTPSNMAATTATLVKTGAQLAALL